MHKLKVLVVLGSGGHTAQMLRLIDKLGDRYDYEYVIASTDKVSEKHIKHKGRIYRVYDTRKKSDKSVLKVILKYVHSTIEALRILWKSKPDAVIACGPAVCLHICALAKILFRAKLIFFESWIRIRNKSLSGRLIYPFTTNKDLFMVQWPELKRKYKRAVYAGRLG